MRDEIRKSGGVVGKVAGGTSKEGKRSWKCNRVYICTLMTLKFKIIDV